MYIFDTSAFITMGHYYPSRFPSLWAKIDELLDNQKLWSVKDVRRELEIQSHFDHIDDWVKNNARVFRKPTDSEM